MDIMKFDVLLILRTAVSCVFITSIIIVEFWLLVFKWLYRHSAYRTPCKKDSRLLSQIPGTAMQVLLKYLSSSDHANLRMVDTSVCKHTSHHLPCLHLRLCTSSSSKQQLEEWHEATQGHSSQHVTSVHVHMTGAVPAELFEVTMQKVSQRYRSVQELHLVAYGSASLTSLQPLCNFFLTCNLQSLVIKGIALQDLDNNMHQLTSTVLGWCKLKTLFLHVPQTQGYTMIWSKCLVALLCLQSKFQFLQQLEITIPSLSYGSMAAQDASPAQGPPAVSRSAAVGKDRAYSAMVEVLAAFSHSVLLDLKCLQVLKAAQVPDIWEAAISATDSDRAAAQKIIRVYLGGGLLAEDATTALSSTLDDFGCWVLRQHHNLQQLHISTAGNSSCCSMTWQRPLAPADSTCPDWSVDTTYASDVAWPLHTNTTDGSAATTDDSDQSSLLVSFMQHMSLYTSRPISIVLQHISRCHFKLQYHNLDGLAQLLTGANSLQSLEVMFDDQGLPASDTPAVGSAFATGTIKAAAAVHGLQSLTINMAAATRVDLTDDLLLPLTAAAAGGPIPGSSLRKLELLGPFVAATDESQTVSLPNHSFKHNLRLVLEALGEGIQEGWSAARWKYGCGACLPADLLMPLADRRWYTPLRKLSNLCELIVENQHHDLLILPCQYLPKNLRMLKCSRLKIVSPTVSFMRLPPLAINSIVNEQHIFPGVADLVQRYKQVATLHTLQLDCCQLESPKHLASHKLQELIVSGSCWPGGWQQAAAAWPALERLSYSQSAPSIGRKHRDDICIIHDAFEGFDRLRYLNMSNLPVSAFRELQPEQHWFTNVKQVSLFFLPDADAVGYWLEKAWQRAGQEPSVTDGTIRNITAMMGWEFHLYLQQQMPWAGVVTGVHVIMNS